MPKLRPTTSTNLQVFFLRLRTLFAPHVRVPQPLLASLQAHRVPLKPPDDAPARHGLPLGSHVALGGDGSAVTHAAQLLAFDAVRSEWTFDARQRTLPARLRANAPMLAFAAFLVALATFNTFLLPVRIDVAVAAHPRADLVAALATEPYLASGARPVVANMHVLFVPLCACELCAQS